MIQCAVTEDRSWGVRPRSYSWFKAGFGGLVSALLLCAAARPAAAQSIIKQPGNHPKYTVEVEPHGLFGLVGSYYGVSLGIGGRLSFPIVQNGFIPHLNNSIAITFGADWLHDTGCYRTRVGCGTNWFFFPVAMQWNFFFTREWSAFGEPGLALYHRSFSDEYCRGDGFVRCPTRTSVTPVLNIGGRYHFNQSTALTMRIGYPAFSVGVSFM